MKTLYISFLFISILPVTDGELFTAIATIKTLLETLKYFLNLFPDYVEAENRRFSYVKEQYEVFKRPLYNSERFIENPIKVFLLVNKLYNRWKDLKNVMNRTTYHDILEEHNVKDLVLMLPGDEDKNGVIVSLERLHSSYKIPLSSLAVGQLASGLKSLFPLTAADCYHIGKTIEKLDTNFVPVPWMEEALNRVKKEKKKTINKEKLLLELAFEYFKVGNYSQAVKLAEELLKLNPKSDVPYQVFKNHLRKRKSLNQKKTEQKIDHKTASISRKDRLCQGERLLDPIEESKLKCYYLKRHSPYLVLQPIKVEDAHLMPWVAVFYDIFSDRDIELIKNLSNPILERAEIELAAGGGGVTDTRISKSAWLMDKVHPRMAQLTQYIEEITGLDNKNSGEPLQIVNYGVGGHYDLHVDFEEDKVGHIFTLRGRRIATLLIYMSDVTAGGATVFPLLNIAVWPKKGSGAFWYNLYKTGDVNYDTTHAACPVLAGNKWVSNKWIHSFHQEFRRPCGLNKNDLHDKYIF